MKRAVQYLFAAWCAMSMASLAAAERDARKHEVVKLAEGVYAFMWSDPLSSPEPNVLFIINDDDVVVVDSSLYPSTSRQVIAEIRKLTDKPVRYVVNTHWHDDHVFGNSVYKDAWPGVEFIAHVNTRIDAEAKAFGVIQQDLIANAEQLEKYRVMLNKERDDKGKALSAARKKRLKEMVIPEYTRYMDEIRTVRMQLPDVTFTDNVVLQRGARTIELHYLGLGNTRGDVVVYLPAEKLLATGDLVVYPTPFGIGSYYKEWIDTLDRLSRFDAQIIFLGHGVIQHDMKYVRQVHDLLAALVSRVEAEVAKGSTLEQVQKTVTLDDWKVQLAGADELKQRAFDSYFVKPAVEREYYQAKGQPDPNDSGPS